MTSSFGAPATTAPPRPVQTSFTLWIASIVVGVLGGIVSIVFAPSAAEIAGITGDTSGAAQTGAVVGGIAGAVIGIVFLLLFVFFAVRMRQGQNWARITLTVLGALSLLFSLLGFAATAAIGAIGATVPGGALGTILTVVQLLLTLAAVVFMYVRPAGDYFTAMSMR